MTSNRNSYPQIVEVYEAIRAAQPRKGRLQTILKGQESDADKLAMTAAAVLLAGVDSGCDELAHTVAGLYRQINECDGRGLYWQHWPTAALLLRYSISIDNFLAVKAGLSARGTLRMRGSEAALPLSRTPIEDDRLVDAFWLMHRTLKPRWLSFDEHELATLDCLASLHVMQGASVQTVLGRRKVILECMKEQGFPKSAQRRISRLGALFPLDTDRLIGLQAALAAALESSSISAPATLSWELAVAGVSPARAAIIKDVTKAMPVLNRGEQVKLRLAQLALMAELEQAFALPMQAYFTVALIEEISKANSSRNEGGGG